MRGRFWQASLCQQAQYGVNSDLVQKLKTSWCVPSAGREGGVRVGVCEERLRDDRLLGGAHLSRAARPEDALPRLPPLAASQAAPLRPPRGRLQLSLHGPHHTHVVYRWPVTAHAPRRAAWRPSPTPHSTARAGASRRPPRPFMLLYLPQRPFFDNLLTTLLACF